MAWRSSGLTNAGLVANLAENGLITSSRVRTAMLEVDRAHYALSAPYQDSPQPIGHAATISAPHMHAAAVESLLPYLRRGARVLDIGSGSGYLTHVLARMVFGGGKEEGQKEEGEGGVEAEMQNKQKPNVEEVGQSKSEEEREGLVVGLDHILPLVRLAERNMRKSEDGRELLDRGRVRFVQGDGRKGWKMNGGEEGWDAIHVGAAAVEAHDELIQQLARPGRMFIPVGNSYQQHIWVIDKKADGEVVRKKGTGVIYVPLTDAPQ